MMEDEFRKVDAELMVRCDEVLKQRGSAYATQADRFSNFKEIAQQVGCSPLHVCHIYLLKGMSVVNKLMRGETVPGEHEHERFADAINYLRLGYALRQEIKENRPFMPPIDEAHELNEQEWRRLRVPAEQWERQREEARGDLPPTRPLR